MAEPAYPLTLPEREDGGVWPLQGDWTYEDFLRLPDDRNRYEVIRGHLYVSPPPIYDHQYVVGEAHFRLAAFVRERALGVILMAPFAVRLPHRIGDPVEPDLLFIRSENQPRPGDKYFQGVPDLVVEVLSPSTRRVDLRIKLAAYRDAGVPEYWAIDPYSRTLVVYGLAAGEYVELFRGGAGETVRSAVLPDLEIDVASLFPR